MDRVCRTCMRIIDVNEVAISINGTDLREKLQVCFPELVLDSVVDPKMCNPCSVALALSFRFKSICNEAEKTINKSMQKTNDGSVKPLSEIQLLTLGRRDFDDLGVGNLSNFGIDKEIEIQTSAELYSTQSFEPLELLSNVASHAAKADSPNGVSMLDDLEVRETILPQNWDDEIQSTRIERTPFMKKKIISNHIQRTIEDVIARVCAPSPKRKPQNKSKVSVPNKRHKTKVLESTDTPRTRKPLFKSRMVTTRTHTISSTNTKSTSEKKDKNKAIQRKEPPLRISRKASLRTHKPMKVTSINTSQSPKSKKTHPVFKTEDLLLKKERKRGENKLKLHEIKTEVHHIKVEVDPLEILDTSFKTNLVMEFPNMRQRRTSQRVAENKQNLESSQTGNKDENKMVKSEVLEGPITKNLETPKVTDNVVSAIEKLLKTPEYQKLLQLQTKTKTKVPEQLLKLQAIFNDHKQSCKRTARVKYKLEPKVESAPALKKPLKKLNSSRAAKALEDIKLDLAEIHEGVERQSHVLKAQDKTPLVSSKDDTHLKNTKPVKEELDITENIIKITDLPKKTKRMGEDAIKITKTRRKHFYGHRTKKKKPLVCDKCGKAFRYQSHLNVHRRAHIVLKKFQCDLCSKCFSLEHYLTLHTAMHFSAGDHQCPICEKYFSSRPVLKKHAKTHTGEKPYKCKVCKRKFTQKTNLLIHMNGHTKTRRFICHNCGTAFYQKIHLEGHMRTHTGERPYACDLCPKAFVKRSVLRDHKAIHASKPFMCDNCYRMYTDEKSLVRHLVKYKDEDSSVKCAGKRYCCSICSRYFATHYSYNRHLKMHGNNVNKSTS